MDFVIWICGFVLLAVSSATACTIGAFGPGSTSDGRPVLWKNRDVDNPNQELRFFSDGRYRYIANVYAGESLKVWAGINQAGFAVMNSDSYNIGGDGGDDGLVMKLALASCATVEDFARLMDSLNIVGREVAANFGVFDSTGMTSIFEAANTWYVRYDADDESLGFLIRANYSMSGDTSRQLGRERYERTMQLVVPARRENRITVRFIVQTLARDIGTVDFNPYPLPFYGTCGELPYGYVPATSTICRSSTRSVEIITGSRPDEPAGKGMMWVVLGPPESCLPVPVWVQAGPVPDALNGPERSEICDEALMVREYVCSDSEHPSAINTFCLYGVLESFAPAESAIFELTAQREAEWPGGPSEAEAVYHTTEICRTVLEAYQEFWARHDRARPVPVLDSEPGTFPTITRNRLVIQLPDRQERVRVYDVQGRLVQSLAVPPGENRLSWNTETLPAGGYFLVFEPGPSGPNGSDACLSRFIRLP